MNDINFDELDAAVNSALRKDTGKDAASTQAVSTPQEPMATQNETAPAGIASPRASVRNQRRGQFMDMVHPSSDMRRGDSASTLPSARRQSAPLVPLSRDIVEAESAPAGAAENPATLAPTPSVASAPHEVETERPVEAVSQTNNPVQSEVSAVGEVQGLEPKAPTESVGGTQIDEVQQAEMPGAPLENPDLSPADETAAVDTPTEADEVTKPFIDGASVDKRPLGAFAESNLQSENEVDTPKTEDDKEQSFGAYDPINYDVASTEAAVVESEADTSLEDNKNTSAENDAENSDSLGAAAGSAGALSQSIPQQYRPHLPATDDEEEPSGNVFSAEQYDAPTSEQKPKSRIALVVVVLLLMVVLGVGAAYAIFVLKLL